MPAPGLLCDVRMPPGRRDESLTLTLTYEPGATSALGALIASPLPFLGGDMDNNVVRALARVVARHGMPVLRYDYRSVGDSRDAVPGEARYETWRRVEESGDRSAIAADAAEALRRARRLFAPALLAGYSFGCWTAVHSAAEPASAVPLVLVAPPLAHVDLSPVATHAAPALLVFAADDTLSPPPSQDELRTRFPAAEIVVVAGADHFFRDHEHDLERAVTRFLRSVAA